MLLGLCTSMCAHITGNCPSWPITSLLLYVEMEGTGVEASIYEWKGEREKEIEERQEHTYKHAHTFLFCNFCVRIVLLYLFALSSQLCTCGHSWYIGWCSSYWEIKGVSIVYEQYVWVIACVSCMSSMCQLRAQKQQWCQYSIYRSHCTVNLISRHHHHQCNISGARWWGLTQIQLWWWCKCKFLIATVLPYLSLMHTHNTLVADSNRLLCVAVSA